MHRLPLTRAKHFKLVAQIAIGLGLLITTSGMSNVDKYQRFRVALPIDDACDGALNRQLSNPNFGLVRQINLFNDGRIYKALFDGEPAEVLIVANNRSALGCTYFRTVSGVVHKVETAYTSSRGWIVRYNGDYGQLPSELIGRRNLFLDQTKPSLNFSDSQGVKHSFVIFREEVALKPSQTTSTIPVSSNSVSSIESLPDANYRYCNYAPNADITSSRQNRAGKWCFIFGKKSNRIVGVLRLISNTTGKDGLCIQGDLTKNSVNGQLFYTPFSGPYFGPYQWGPTTSLQNVLEYIVRQQPAVYGFYGTTDFLNARQPYLKGKDLIFFPITFLNLDDFVRHSAGNILPPISCD